MTKRCVYCKIGLVPECVLDVCDKCGLGVWGEKMFSAIKENMGEARKRGDLHQGSVTD